MFPCLVQNKSSMNAESVHRALVFDRFSLYMIHLLGLNHLHLNTIPD